MNELVYSESLSFPGVVGGKAMESSASAEFPYLFVLLRSLRSLFTSLSLVLPSLAGVACPLYLCLLSLQLPLLVHRFPPSLYRLSI